MNPRLAFKGKGITLNTLRFREERPGDARIVLCYILRPRDLQIPVLVEDMDPSRMVLGRPFALPASHLRGNDCGHGRSSCFLDSVPDRIGSVYHLDGMDMDQGHREKRLGRSVLDRQRRIEKDEGEKGREVLPARGRKRLTGRHSIGSPLSSAASSNMVFIILSTSDKDSS